MPKIKINRQHPRSLLGHLRWAEYLDNIILFANCNIHNTRKIRAGQP